MGWTMSSEEGNFLQLGRSAGKPSLPAYGEGSQLGRKFLKVAERVSYELNFSSYPLLRAKIEQTFITSSPTFFPSLLHTSSLIVFKAREKN